MSPRTTARLNVLTFHTAHWYARERAKKRVEQLLVEMSAVEAWLELEEEGDAQPASSAKGGPQRGSPNRASGLRLCE
jgi:hypothetical protein